MDFFGPWHIIIVACVFVMLFGAKRLPDAARSLGKSARILKTEMKSLHDDDADTPPSVTMVTNTGSTDAESFNCNDRTPTPVVHS